MSKVAWATFLTTFACSASLIYYVHYRERADKQFLDETLLENEERRAKKRQELREEYAKNQALHQTLTGDTVDEKPVHQSTIEAELVTNEIQQQLPPSPVSVSVISSQQFNQSNQLPIPRVIELIDDQDQRLKPSNPSPNVQNFKQITEKYHDHPALPGIIPILTIFDLRLLQKVIQYALKQILFMDDQQPSKLFLFAAFVKICQALSIGNQLLDEEKYQVALEWLGLLPLGTFLNLLHGDESGKGISVRRSLGLNQTMIDCAQMALALRVLHLWKLATRAKLKRVNSDMTLSKNSGLTPPGKPSMSLYYEVAQRRYSLVQNKWLRKTILRKLIQFWQLETRHRLVRKVVDRRCLVRVANDLELIQSQDSKVSSYSNSQWWLVSRALQGYVLGLMHKALHRRFQENREMQRKLTQFSQWKQRLMLGQWRRYLSYVFKLKVYQNLQRGNLLRFWLHRHKKFTLNTKIANQFDQVRLIEWVHTRFTRIIFRHRALEQKAETMFEKHLAAHVMSQWKCKCLVRQIMHKLFDEWRARSGQMRAVNRIASDFWKIKISVRVWEKWIKWTVKPRALSKLRLNNKRQLHHVLDKWKRVARDYKQADKFRENMLMVVSVFRPWLQKARLLMQAQGLYEVRLATGTLHSWHNFVMLQMDARMISHQALYVWRHSVKIAQASKIFYVKITRGTKVIVPKQLIVEHLHEKTIKAKMFSTWLATSKKIDSLKSQAEDWQRYHLMKSFQRWYSLVLFKQIQAQRTPNALKERVCRQFVSFSRRIAKRQRDDSFSLRNFGAKSTYRIKYQVMNAWECLFQVKSMEQHLCEQNLVCYLAQCKAFYLQLWVLACTKRFFEARSQSVRRQRVWDKWKRQTRLKYVSRKHRIAMRFFRQWRSQLHTQRHNLLLKRFQAKQKTRALLSIGRYLGRIRRGLQEAQSLYARNTLAHYLQAWCIKQRINSMSRSIGTVLSLGATIKKSDKGEHEDVNKRESVVSIDLDAPIPMISIQVSQAKKEQSVPSYQSKSMDSLADSKDDDDDKDIRHKNSLIGSLWSRFVGEVSGALNDTNGMGTPQKSTVYEL